MKWLKKKQKEPGPLPPIVARLTVCINERVRKCADLLQQKTNRLSKIKLKWMLFLFCALCIGGSVYAILSGLHPKKKSFVVTPIRVLPLVKENGSRPAITNTELTKIHRFKKYLDSLSTTADGKALRDSFLSSHPHLMDTILYLESLFQQQNKN